MPSDLLVQALRKSYAAVISIWETFAVSYFTIMGKNGHLVVPEDFKTVINHIFIDAITVTKVEQGLTSHTRSKIPPILKNGEQSFYPYVYKQAAPTHKSIEHSEARLKWMKRLMAAVEIFNQHLTYHI